MTLSTLYDNKVLQLYSMSLSFIISSLSVRDQKDSIPVQSVTLSVQQMGQTNRKHPVHWGTWISGCLNNAKH